ncbi:MAG: energy transducer TonB [Acidobacteriia bacterium]|nr:energy transducer TonB [Terriglobia bacterium]
MITHLRAKNIPILLHNRSWLAFAVIVLLNTAAFAGDSLEEHLNAEYSGKVLTQRHFLSGHKLVYDAEGNPASGSRVGPWTLDGKIRVQQINLRGSSTIDIRGERLLLISGSDKNPSQDFFETFVDFFEQNNNLRRHLSSEEWKKLRDKQQVQISITRPAGFDETSAGAAIMKVFLAPGERLSDFVPDYWKSRAQQTQGTPGSPQSLPPKEPYKVEGGVTPPHPKKMPDPSYAEPARQIRYQGTVVLWMVVDESGGVRDVRVQRALGAGLDDKAVDAVRRWRFDPATLNGNPVAVQINVEVNFRLY